MAACNGGKEKADNQTEKQTESVKPTEEVAMAEAVTEVTTEAGSMRQRKILLKIQKRRLIKKITDPQIIKLLQSRKKSQSRMTSFEQKAPVNDIEEAGGNQSNAGNGGQTRQSERQCEQHSLHPWHKQSTECCVTCNSKVSGRRMITTQSRIYRTI